MPAAYSLLGLFAAKPRKPDMPPLATQLGMLRQVADVYIAAALENFDGSSFPFKQGDLVTPRGTGSLKHVGRPHIVVETNANAPETKFDSPGTPGYRARFNMRVVAMVNRSDGGFAIMPWWVEAGEFVPMTVEGDTATWRDA